jgi:hypothetical protein
MYNTIFQRITFPRGLTSNLGWRAALTSARHLSLTAGE